MLKSDSKCHMNTLKGLGKILAERISGEAPESKSKPKPRKVNKTKPREEIIEIDENSAEPILPAHRLIGGIQVFGDDLNQLTNYLGSLRETDSYLGSPIVESAIHLVIQEKPP